VDSNKPWIGVEIKKGEDGRYTIRNVIPGSPAEKAGLELDDVVMAFDDRAVGPGGPAEAVSAHKPGDVVHVLVMRLGRIQELSLTIGSNPHATYSLKPADHPTPQQKAIYDSWLGVKSK
jgi:predicted metalloprotease with PDZ domain